MTQSRITLHQKPNGQHFRITVQHRPKSSTLLLELQEQLAHQLPDFTPKDQAYLHLTLLHLGIPEDLYFELRKLLPNLAIEQFMQQFEHLLLELDRLCKSFGDELLVRGTGMEYYGSLKSPAVALSVERNTALDSLHLLVFEVLVRFLESLSVPDPMSFIKISRNLRHSPPEAFSPHITLGRVAAASIQLQELPRLLEVRVGQPYLAHVTVL